MHTFLCFSLLAVLSIPVSLSAQNKLEDNLKAVMMLFDKNQKEAQARIDFLQEANNLLAETNVKLNEELEATQSRIAVLEKENLLLRSKFSDEAVKEIETASLPVDSPRQLAEADTPIPDFTPASLKGVGESFPGSPVLGDGVTLVVNINTASEKEIRMLPGVGPAMAKKIFEERPYSSIWDLMKIPGMGRKRIDTLSPHLVTE